MTPHLSAPIAEASLSPYRPSERGRTQFQAASSSEALDSDGRVRLSRIARTQPNPFVLPPSLTTRDKLELMSSLAVFVGVLSISLQTPKESPPTVALCGTSHPQQSRAISTSDVFHKEPLGCGDYPSFVLFPAHGSSRLSVLNGSILLSFPVFLV